MSGGVGTFVRVGFYDQHLAAGADGTMHLAFVEGAAERVFYARCSANCGDPASWNPVQITSTTQLGVIATGPYGLGVDSTGRLHMLIGAVPPVSQRANAIVYATCASNCTTPASWTFLDLSSLAANASVITTTRPLMVESNGRVSFFSADPGTYFSCASNCTSLGNWTAGVQLNGSPLHAGVDGSGVTHVMLRQGTTAGGDTLLRYARCASACNTPASWQISSLGFLTRSPEFAASLAVTASGRVFMVFNQGTLSMAGPDDRKLFVNTCAGATCLDLNTWTGFNFGALDEGVDGAWLQTSGEGAVLATVSGFDLNLRGCDMNCENAGSWGAPGVVDAASAVNASVPPATGSNCPNTAESASWWPYRPVVGISSRGVAVVHNPYAIVKCPGNPNPSRLPTIGRVASTF